MREVEVDTRRGRAPGGRRRVPGAAMIMLALAPWLASCSRVGFSPSDAQRPPECGVAGGCDGATDFERPRECGMAGGCDAAAPAVSQLSVKPLSHQLAISLGGNPSAESIFLRNNGESDISWTALAVREDLVTPCPWITAVDALDPGPIPPGTFRNLTLRYGASSLGVGRHICIVRVSDATPGTQKLSVPITLDVKATSSIAYLQSWERTGCAADGASSSTAADCDYGAVPALEGSELLSLGFDASFYADGAVGSLGAAEVLYFRIPIYFSSFEGIETPELFLLRDGDADAYPKIANWAGANGENRQLFILCKPTDPPGDNNYWPGVGLPVDQWIVIRLRVELASGSVFFYEEGNLWKKAACRGLPLSYANLGYAFVTTWGRSVLVDRVEISDTEFAAPLTLP